VQFVIAAVAEGMQGAFAINNALLEADAASGTLRQTAAGKASGSANRFFPPRCRVFGLTRLLLLFKAG
jgi:hypothetical protein